MEKSERDEHAQVARNALIALEAALVDGKAAARDEAMASVRQEAATLGNPWPLYSAWGLMQKHRERLQQGEVLDVWHRQHAPVDPYLIRFVHVVWGHINTLEHGRGAADSEPKDWLSHWLTVRERALSAVGTARQNALDECDALLEMITRLFSAVYPLRCASDAWVEDLREQAIAQAQYARCHVDPANVLSLADDNRTIEHLLVMSRALGAVMRERLYTDATSLEDATAHLASLQQGDRLNNSQEQADRIGRVLRYWAALDDVVAYILKRRFGVVLTTFVKHELRPIPWVKGIEQGIALVGPPQAGKTSLMFASEHVTTDLVPDLPDVNVHHALGNVADVNDKRSRWKQREERFNTAQSAKLSARTELHGLCSFGFFDLSGEEYFPTAGAAVPNYEAIRRRYETSPPSVVAMIFKADGDPATIGPAFEDLMTIVGLSAEKAAQPAATLEALNAARPVYFLIGKADLILAAQTNDHDQRALLDGASVDDRLVRALSAQLTDEVIDLRAFGPESDAAVAEDLETRVRYNAEMCRTPGRLRAVIKALELTREQRKACRETHHTNLRLLFVQCGAAPGGEAEFPPIHGVDTFWRDLWTAVPPATAAARQSYLTSAFVTQPTTDVYNARELGKLADAIQAPAWPTAQAERLRALVGTKSLTLANDILASDHRQVPLDQFGSSREWSGGSLELLAALDTLVAPFRDAQKDFPAALEKALHKVIRSLGAPAEEAVGNLEGFVAVEAATRELSGMVDDWRKELAGLDLGEASFMFHGAIGALRGSSPLRSEPADPFETNAALAWLANGDTLEQRLIEIFGNAIHDEHEGIEAATLLTEGLNLLANYTPAYRNLAVALLEFDHTKVQALESLAPKLADMRARGIRAVLALRQLAMATTRAPALEKRVAEAATLMVVGRVVRELGFDPVKLLQGIGGGGAVQLLTNATEALNEAKTASTAFELPMMPSTKRATVLKHLNSAWNTVADYADPSWPRLPADPTTADVVRELRRFGFVTWFTQQLAASNAVKDSAAVTALQGRDLAEDPVASVARSAVATAASRATTFATALGGYVEALRVAIIEERVEYLVKGDIMEQLPESAQQLFGQIFQQSQGASLTAAEREAHLLKSENTYFSAIKLALGMQPK